MDIENVELYKIMTIQELKNNAINLLKTFNIKSLSKDENDIVNIIYDNSKNRDDFMKNLNFLIGTLNGPKNSSLSLSDSLKQIKNKTTDYNTSSIYNDYEQLFRYEINKLLTEVKIVEGLFICPKCGSKKVQSIEKQTRRADEPPTNFCYCTNCKNRWTE